VVGDTPRRDLVLPALNAVQARIGWVSRGALNEISRRLDMPPPLFSMKLAMPMPIRVPWPRSRCLRSRSIAAPRTRSRR